MPEPNFSSAQLANELSSRLADPNVLTADQAKLYSHAVRRAWSGEGLRSWAVEQSRQQLRDAVRLIEAGRILRAEGESRAANNAFRRAGDLLEWLTRAKEEPLPEEPVPLALLSAACFQLAGFPAMALGLLAQSDSLPASGQLFRAFLRADFDGVLTLCASYWQEHQEQTKPQGAGLSCADGEEKDTRPDFLANETVRCLGLIAHSLRGDHVRRLNLAVTKLQALARHAARAISSEHVWLVLALTAEVAAAYSRDSLWRGLDSLRPSLSPDGADRCARFVRSMFRDKRGLLWPSQTEGLNRLAARTSFAMCTPTGSGKTTVAELALWQALYPPSVADADPFGIDLRASPLVLYLVPSRALAAEVEARLSRDIARIESEVIITGLYGGADWSLADAWLTADKPTALVCTVEMAESIWRYFGPLLSARMELVIIDEAHQVQFDGSPQAHDSLRRAENRAGRLESFVTRLFANVKHCRAIALSAVAGGAENAIARWIGNDPDASPVGSDYRSTRQLVGALECRANGTARIRLELLNGQPLELAGRGAEEAYVPVPFPEMPAVTANFKSDLGAFCRAHIVWASVQLAHAGKRVLVSVAQNIDSPLQAFRTLITAEKQIRWAGKIPPFFRPPEGAARTLFDNALSACNDYCGPDSHERFLLGKGIAVHHGQLPVRVRRLMTEVIKAGITPITIATSTLTEGVNMPFDVILIAAVVRSQQQGTNRYTYPVISAEEFSNLAGRAGRPGAGVEGMTLVALPMDTTTSAPATAKKQRRMIHEDKRRFDVLMAKLKRAGEGQGTSHSPLAALLSALWLSWHAAFPRLGMDHFLTWLETAGAPSIALPDAETNDLLDSLDLVLLSAIEEAEQLRGAALSPSEIEEQLANVWARSYARFAATESERLRQIFMRRGQNLVVHVYPDAAQRRQLYRLGLPPRQGGAFLLFAERIEGLLRTAENYSQWTSEERANFIERLALLSQQSASCRFREATPETWPGLLRWWLRVPGAKQPQAGQVRDWLKAATGDFEYRLGTALGVTVAAVWNRANGGTMEIPDLDRWKEMTKLPWAALWLREFLAWGTLDATVAYLIANGNVTTREEAERRSTQYVAWFSEHYPDAEADEQMHPHRLREWCEAAFARARRRPRDAAFVRDVHLERDFRQTAQADFPVIPVANNGHLSWLDPAGFLLAESSKPAQWAESNLADRDFTLQTATLTVQHHLV